MQIDSHSALVYVMVLVSASDDDMTDAELDTMGKTVRYLPVFRGFDSQRLPAIADACAELLSDEEGLDKALDAIEEALPDHLRETAYAIACDVAAADGQVAQEEMRLLELLRYRLRVGRLPAAAIERAARARHQTL
ncbi:tellurite resistance TerB family protein [Algihabitans albus]|uniref:tellurite resistance TerB family protein n=1 Tax=Algihabitans albus TaxID=2164067 RepID=UPI0035D0D402